MALPVSERGYPHPELLAEADWLSTHLTDSAVRVIDVRSEKDYAHGHIPRAVNLNGFSLGGLRTGSEMPNPAAFARLVGLLGIDESISVVIYDTTGPMAGMVAWAFLYYGHPDTRLLDGGLTKWTAEGLPLSTEAVSHEPRKFSPHPIEGLYCRLGQAKAAVGQDDFIFWDTRSLGEFQGTKAPYAPPPRLGHLPGAIHLEWTELFDHTTKTLKPAKEITDLLQLKGITPEATIATY